MSRMITDSLPVIVLQASSAKFGTTIKIDRGKKQVEALMEGDVPPSSVAAQNRSNTLQDNVLRNASRRLRSMNFSEPCHAHSLVIFSDSVSTRRLQNYMRIDRCSYTGGDFRSPLFSAGISHTDSSL